MKPGIFKMMGYFKIIFKFFLLFFVCLSPALMSQHVEDGRVEIEVSGFSDAYFLLPVGSNGILLFGQSNKLDKGKLLFEFSKYDTRFKKDWTAGVAIDRKKEYVFHHYDDLNNKLYVLMSKRRAFLLHEDYSVLELDVNTSSVRVLEGRFISYALIKDFFAYNSIVYLAGHYYPSRTELFFRQSLTLVGLYIPAIFGSLRYKLNPLLYMSDFRKNTLNRHMYDSDGNTKVLSLSFDRAREEVFVLVSDKSNKKTTKHEILQFNKNAEKVRNIILDVENYDLTSGKALSVIDDEQIVIGTYTNKPKRYKESSFGGEKSMASASIGLYYAKIADGKQDFIHFYPFHRFKNFYNFLTQAPPTKSDVQMSRSQSVKRTIGLEYNLLVHDLIQRDNNEYIMIAEAYYPEYERRCYYQYNPYSGFNERTCYDIFLGYRFTHTIIAAFDSDGVLKWDNSFEMWEILTTNLKPQIRYFFEDDEILLLYAYGNEIKTMIITGSQVVDGGASAKINILRPDDNVRETIGSGIEYWYEDYFIVYAYQSIKSDPRAGQGRRRVFYFNKIQYK